MQLSAPGVQRLGPGDEGRLRALRLRSLADAPDAFGSTLTEVSARPAESWTQQLADMPTWVAVDGGTDVGIVRVADDRDDQCRAWLISMWVAPEGRGRGLGNALVAATITWARQQGRDTLLLDVAVDNTPAIGLYRRHGFRPTGRTTTLPPPRDHIVEQEMARTIG